MRDGFEPIPGYEDTGYGINHILICLRCGVTLSECLTTKGFAWQIHDQWHESLRSTADQAYQASAWTNVIG